MSDNLYLKDLNTGESICLRQTPSFITYMCLSYDENEEPDGGHQAVLKRYLIYLDSLLSGHWRVQLNPGLFELVKRQVKEEKERLSKVGEPFFYTV